MAAYVVTWGVIVVGEDITDPVEAARRGRQMADEHFRSLWGVEDVDTGEVVTVDVVKGVIVNPELDDGEDESVA